MPNLLTYGTQEQDLLQLGDVLGSLQSVTADFNALVKRREQHLGPAVRIWG